MNVSIAEIAPVAGHARKVRRQQRGGQHTTVRATQRLSAPRGRVFDAWLDPAIAGQWLFATALRPMHHVTIDARVGGSFRFVEQRDGEEHVRTGSYLEIVRPERLAFSLAMENDPYLTSCVVVDFLKRGAGCELIVTQEDVPAACAAQARNRWHGMLYGLSEMLPKKERRPERQ